MRSGSVKVETETGPVEVWRISEDATGEVEDVVAREFPLTVILNDRELVTLLCSPAELKHLAIGFLFSEGLILAKGDLKKVTVDETRGVVRVETAGATGQADEVFRRFISSGCGRGASFYSAADATGMEKIDSAIRVSPAEIGSLVREFQRRSDLYRATGGVHSAALCDTSGILVFAQDVGRHNAVDKIFGRCLLEDIPTEDCLVVTSGRISSEILLKVARRRIPLIASKSAPTDLGVKLASDLGITLLGFVRGKRMNVYANRWRIHDAGP
jgi:FdhD protein